MGYSEALCQICGVSFNIARLRTREEPLSAAWRSYGGSYLEVDEFLCQREAGCLYYNRETELYKSPYKPEKPNPICKETGDEDVDGDNSAPDAKASASDDDDVLSNFGSDEGGDLEHIAGPNCSLDNAYNGNHITVEEMQGCRTAQFLVNKPEEWRPSADDEPFEQNSPMFLSGLSNGMRSRDEGGDPDDLPHRHDECQKFHTPDNVIYEPEFQSMPFHPYCMEVFKRACILQGSDLDIEGLIGWWQRDGDYDSFVSFPRTDGISALQEQWWSHANGTEFVAANPLLVPGLQALCTTARPLDENFSTQQGAFELPPPASAAPNSSDSFEKLPVELRIIILSHISSQDIANLRLASPVFRQLPISVFHDLITREMPWLWEAWHNITTLPYSAWSAKEDPTTHAITARTAQDFHHTSEAYIPTKLPTVPVPNVFPQARTNWYRLYVAVRRGLASGELKGLQNRRRIWTDCQEILRRIEEYRGLGEIPVTDLEGLVRWKNEEARRRWEAGR